MTQKERALTVWQVRCWHVRHSMFILLSYELNFHTRAPNVTNFTSQQLGPVS